MVLSPIIDKANTFRAVLDWGKDPVDLDAHLAVQHENREECEVSDGHKQCETKGGVTATLDTDARKVSIQKVHVWRRTTLRCTTHALCSYFSYN